MWSRNCAWPRRRPPPRAPLSKYGALLMLSMPPATAMRALPARIASCASIAVFRPEPHILLTVVVAADIGTPAAIAACRAGALPMPAGSTQPISTSSTSSPSTAARDSAARIATAPSCGAGWLLSAPRKPPMGVRQAAVMTTSSPWVALAPWFAECGMRFSGWSESRLCGLVEDFAPYQHPPNFGGAGADFVEFGVAQQARRRKVVGVAVAAEQLNRVKRGRGGFFRGE